VRPELELELQLDLEHSRARAPEFALALALALGAATASSRYFSTHVTNAYQKIGFSALHEGAAGPHPGQRGGRDPVAQRARASAAVAAVAAAAGGR